MPDFSGAILNRGSVAETELLAPSSAEEGSCCQSISYLRFASLGSLLLLIVLSCNRYIRLEEKSSRKSPRVEHPGGCCWC